MISRNTRLGLAECKCNNKCHPPDENNSIGQNHTRNKVFKFDEMELMTSGRVVYRVCKYCYKNCLEQTDKAKLDKLVESIKLRYNL